MIRRTRKREPYLLNAFIIHLHDTIFTNHFILCFWNTLSFCPYVVASNCFDFQMSSYHNLETIEAFMNELNYGMPPSLLMSPRWPKGCLPHASYWLGCGRLSFESPECWHGSFFVVLCQSESLWVVQHFNLNIFILLQLLKAFCFSNCTV